MASRYEVQFTRSAQKEFLQLERALQDRVAESLRVLAQHPFSELLQIKKIKGADAVYRFRLGSYRVVYEVRKAALIVLVIKIAHRKEVYR